MPPLFTISLLFLLIIIIFTSVFRDYITINNILTIKPPLKRKFLIIKWANNILNNLVFPEFSIDKLTKKTKNKNI
jgi:hypothetical protein